MIKKSAIFLVLLMLTACQTDRSGIGYSLGQCCTDNSYRSFSTETRDMPEFLKPLMVANFQAVFSELDMLAVDSDAELNVVLRYEQENIGSQQVRDDFGGHLEPGGNVHYIAKLWVEISDAKSHALLWSGSIQRIHNVEAGEYMHNDKASVALQIAFKNLLKHYPLK